MHINCIDNFQSLAGWTTSQLLVMHLLISVANCSMMMDQQLKASGIEAHIDIMVIHSGSWDHA